MQALYSGRYPLYIKDALCPMLARIPSSRGLASMEPIKGVVWGISVGAKDLDSREENLNIGLDIGFGDGEKVKKFKSDRPGEPPIEDIVSGIYVGATDLESHPNDAIFGVDLGPTNLRLCVIERDKPKMVENVEGGPSSPSIAAFNHNGEVVVGEIAKQEAVSDQIVGAKLLFGSRFEDGRTIREMRRVAYKIVKGPDGDAAWIECNGKQFSPSHIGSFVLGKMKETAEGNFRTQVKHVVLTVPTYFNEAQRKATKVAGELAGLNVRAILDEPVATCYSCDGLDGLEEVEDKPIAVVDMGGTSLDVSILALHDGVFKLKATASDHFLGGVDFDNVFVEHLKEEFKKSDGIDLSRNEVALRRLREAAEKAKIELSSSYKVMINLPFIEGSNHLSFTITRLQYEDLICKLVERVKETCRFWLKDSDVEVKDIKKLILSGGMTNIPKLRETITDIFGKSPFKGVHANNAVAIGAAQFGKRQCRDTDYVCSTSPSMCKKLGNFFTRFESVLVSSWIVSRYRGMETPIMSALNVVKVIYYWCESKVLSILRAMFAVGGILLGVVWFFYEHLASWLMFLKSNFILGTYKNDGDVEEKEAIPENDDSIASKMENLVETKCEEIKMKEEPTESGSGWLYGVSICAAGFIVGGVVGGVLVAFLKRN